MQKSVVGIVFIFIKYHKFYAFPIKQHQKCAASGHICVISKVLSFFWGDMFYLGADIFE